MLNGRHKGGAVGAPAGRFPSCETGLRLAETAGALAGAGAVWPAGAAAGMAPAVKRSRPGSDELPASEGATDDAPGAACTCTVNTPF